MKVNLLVLGYNSDLTSSEKRVLPTGFLGHIVLTHG